RARVKKIVLRAINNTCSRDCCNPSGILTMAGRCSKSPETENAVDRVEAGDDPLSDQVTQCLRGAAAQGAVAGAAVESRHRELVGETVAAMHLDGVAGDPQRHLVDGDLGRRGEQRVGERVGGGTGAVKDAAARLGVAVHLGDLPAYALEIADRPAEGAAFLDVF